MTLSVFQYDNYDYLHRLKVHSLSYCIVVYPKRILQDVKTSGFHNCAVFRRCTWLNLQQKLIITQAKIIE